jgi:hypothetical protein
VLERCSLMSWTEARLLACFTVRPSHSCFSAMVSFSPERNMPWLRILFRHELWTLSIPSPATAVHLSHFVLQIIRGSWARYPRTPRRSMRRWPAKSAPLRATCTLRTPLRASCSLFGGPGVLERCSLMSWTEARLRACFTVCPLCLCVSVQCFVRVAFSCLGDRFPAIVS